MTMYFEWDSQKNQTNYLKHGLNFEDVEFIFSGETITFEDDRYEYGEKRFVTLGKLLGRIVLVVHTQRSNILRIISLRKANEREKKIYYERLEKTR